MKSYSQQQSFISLSQGLKNFTNKEKLVPEQETSTASRNEPYESVLHKYDIAHLIKFSLKTQLEELTHLSSILPTTCISCKEKEEFIEYLINKIQSKPKTINTLEGNLSCHSTCKQNLQHPGIFYN